MKYNETNVKCSIIIVYYNNNNLMQRCLDSIACHAPYGTEIIIINNSPNVCSFIYSPRFNYKINNHRVNCGFGKANNIGLTYANGKYILLLNPDTELTDNFIENTIELLEKYPNIAAVGPKLIDDHNNIQMSAFKFPTLKEYLLRDVLFIEDNSNKIDSIIIDKTLEEDIFKCDWLCGAAILFQRGVLEKIKGFDTRYFMYFEDVDLFKKINDIGYMVAYSPECVVKHINKDKRGIYSEKFNNADRIAIHNFSMLQYWQKYKPEALPVIRSLLFIRSLSRLLVWLLSPSLRERAGRKNVDERIRGYFTSLIISIFR